MADIILSKPRGTGFSINIKGISVSKAVELLRKYKAAYRRALNPPRDGACLEIVFKSFSEVPAEFLEKFGRKKYLLVFDQPDTAAKIYESC